MASRTRSGKVYQPVSADSAATTRKSKHVRVRGRCAVGQVDVISLLRSLPEEIKQAILEHLDLNSKRNARLTNKAFGKIVRSALGSVRCRLPKHAALAASTVAKRLHRLFDTLPDIRSVQLHFIAEESINLLDEEAASPVDDWALQVEHTKLAMALGTLKHLNKLSLHSADQIPLVPYCSLTQLKSLDISHCNFPHQLLQLIPRSLKQLTELLLDMAGPRQETLLQAQDIASLCGLTNLQHLQLGNMTSSTSIPVLQAIGTLTTLTSLRLIRSNDERCSFYEGSGRDFSDLQALSSLKRLSSLESRQLGRGSHNQQDDGDGLLLHKPTREELSSWFPQLQRLYYVRSTMREYELAAVAAMAKGKLELVMGKLGIDSSNGFRPETLEVLSQVPELDINLESQFWGQQAMLGQLPNVTRLQVGWHEEARHRLAGCRCTWCAGVQPAVKLEGA